MLLSRNTLLVAFCLVISATGNPVPNDAPLTAAKEKLRQDGDGDAGDAIEAGFEPVAGAVSQIISGTLTGNIGQLFTGISGTVTDEAAQPGVSAILSGVSIPLSTLWQSGIKAGQQYFNITTESPFKSSTPASQTVKLTPEQVTALQSQLKNQGVAIVPSQQGLPAAGAQTIRIPLQPQADPAQAQRVPAPQQSGQVVAAPVRAGGAVVASTTPTNSEDDDDDDSSEADLKEKKV